MRENYNIKEKGLISIIILVYNHEQFIEQALESFLNQVIDCNVQMIISNDCSKDKSDELIREIVAKHSNGSWVEYFNQETNLGLIGNFTFCLNQCKGEYVALCGGDDYWIDNLKIQKQFDFLESNKDYSVVTADTHYLSGTDISNYTYIETKSSWLNIPVPVSFSFSEVIRRFYPHPNTLFFRNIIELPESFKSFMCEDYPLFMMLADKGRIGFINEVMSVYRIHDTSIIQSDSGSSNKGSNRFFEIPYYMFDVLGEKYRSKIINGLREEYKRFLILKPNKDEVKKINATLDELEEKFSLGAFSAKTYGKITLEAKVSLAKSKSKKIIKRVLNR